MADLCESAIGDYLNVLKGTFEVVSLEESCLLVSPFMRPDNEYIEIELSLQPDGRIRITDIGDTMDYLFVNGVSVRRSPWLRRRVNIIAARFGVRVERGEITTVCESGSLGQGVQAVLSAIQDATYLIYRREERGRPAFDEEVERFLIRSGTSYDERYPLRGKSRLHSFRFHTNRTGDKLLEPLTATTSHAALVKAERLAFWWIDIRDLWPDYTTVAIVDDSERKGQLWEGGPIEVLRSRSDHVILWTNRDELLPILQRA